MLTNTDKNRFYAVIMAGGGGTRLWPWSRKGQTKQMLKVVGERSMFQLTVDRLQGMIDTDHTLVVTTEEQANLLSTQYEGITKENYLLEPLPRGTASVVGLAAINCFARNKDAVMAVLTADHYIKNVPYFCSLLESAFSCAEDRHLVTLGIEPTFPSTGMGYIESGKKIAEVGGNTVEQVAHFREKPDLETAKKFLETGRFSWNSGMFIWRADRILEEIKKDLPDLYEKLMIIAKTIVTSDYDRTVSEIWPTIAPITIDYGVMEKADDVVVLPARGLGWNDIGSWESIYDVCEPDENGNIHISCKALNLDSEGVLCCSENPEKMLIAVGLKDMVIVETEKVVMVCPRSDTQRVREIVQYLKENGLSQYL